ncbi:hypothetical protein D3C87_1267850 [compost metagenome]
MITIANFILFTFVRRFLPAFVRYWAYDVRYNAWANDPKHGDYFQARQSPAFDHAAWSRQRAQERDAIVLTTAQYKRKHKKA